MQLVKEHNLMKSWIRIGLAFALGFLISISVSLANGKDWLGAFQTGLYFAMLIGVFVAILSWGIDIAVEKGYPNWFGFILALCLNALGLIILALLPNLHHPDRPASS
jgi:hypothetical protein